MAQQKPKENNVQIIEVQRVAAKCKDLNDFTILIISHLKKQARRLSIISVKYRDYKQKDSILDKICNLTTCEEYSDYEGMINNDFAELLQQASNQLLKIKQEATKLASDLKSKSQKDRSQQIKEKQQKYDKLEVIVKKIWNRGYYKLLNYRMSVACKQIQRWNIPIITKIQQEKIKNQINDLFK